MLSEYFLQGREGGMHGRRHRLGDLRPAHRLGAFRRDAAVVAELGLVVAAPDDGIAGSERSNFHVSYRLATEAARLVDSARHTSFPHAVHPGRVSRANNSRYG